MGLWPFKSEFEDTAFMYLYPDEYNELNRRLEQRDMQFGETLNNSIRVLEETMENNSMLKSQDVKIEVVGWTNELYSLWHKMEMKHNQNLDHITELVALAVILNPGGSDSKAVEETDSGVWLCYHVNLRTAFSNLAKASCK